MRGRVREKGTTARMKAMVKKNTKILENYKKLQQHETNTMTCKNTRQKYKCNCNNEMKITVWNETNTSTETPTALAIVEYTKGELQRVRACGRTRQSLYWLTMVGRITILRIGCCKKRVSCASVSVVKVFW